jgi:hypothetical protein
LPIKHTDWDVSVEHSRVIQENIPDGVTIRTPVVLKKVPGLTGKRFTETIKSGIWIKPLGGLSQRTFSSVRDISRRSLVVFVSGSSTGRSGGATDYEKVRDMIREKFHDRRATCLDGEMFSRTSMSDYDIDDVISRKYDIDIIEIETVFREDV